MHQRKKEKTYFTGKQDYHQRERQREGEELTILQDNQRFGWKKFEHTGEHTLVVDTPVEDNPVGGDTPAEGSLVEDMRLLEGTL